MTTQKPTIVSGWSGDRSRLALKLTSDISDRGDSLLNEFACRDAGKALSRATFGDAAVGGEHPVSRAPYVQEGPSWSDTDAGYSCLKRDLKGMFDYLAAPSDIVADLKAGSTVIVEAEPRVVA